MSVFIFRSLSFSLAHTGPVTMAPSSNKHSSGIPWGPSHVAGIVKIGVVLEEKKQQRSTNVVL